MILCARGVVEDGSIPPTSRLAIGHRQGPDLSTIWVSLPYFCCFSLNHFSVLLRHRPHEERNLQLLEEVYQMESAFPKHVHAITHDWGQVPTFQGKRWLLSGIYQLSPTMHH